MASTRQTLPTIPVGSMPGFDFSRPLTPEYLASLGYAPQPQSKPAQPTADELSDGFIEFLDQVMDFDLEKIPPILLQELYSKCAREIKKYVKYEDTVSREALMDAVGLALTGKPHPLYTDTQEYKDWYDQMLSIYRND